MVQGSKIQGLPQAVARLVRPGMSIVMGAGLEACIPFAVGHEIIRQGKKDLTLIGPISDTLFDMMVGGGVVKKIIAAWVGNVGAGLGYNFRRAAEGRTIEVENHSNLSVASALDAGGMGLEFGLLRSLFGTDILKHNDNMRVISCPFTGTPHVAVRALTPDLAIIHAQRADEAGNTQLWGNLGIVPEAIKASRQVLVVVEEIVGRDVIRSDPNRTIIPGFKTAAVVEEPWGAHPSPVQGHYGHDDDYYMEYAEATRTAAGAEDWLKNWVLDALDRRAYLDKLGPERLAALRVRNPAPAARVEYGF
ncbi:MAG: CoA-transferase [Pseudomonadota bacterium]